MKDNNDSVRNAAVAVVIEAVRVRVFAGLNDGTHGAADGVRHEAAVKAHAFLGETVHVGRVEQLALVAVAAHRLEREVVAEDEDDVGPLGGTKGDRKGEEGEKEANHGQRNGACERLPINASS